MINEQEGETEFQSLNYDARVVQTVRNLKKLPSKRSEGNKSNNGIEGTISKESQLEVNRDNFEENSVNKQIYYKNINNNEKTMSNKLTKSVNAVSSRRGSTKENINTRISIDGSGNSTSHSNKRGSKVTTGNKILNNGQNTNSNTVNTNSSQAFKYSYSNNIASYSENTKKFQPYKSKSEFQKRLMSENNLIKYKSSCISLIKDDEELKKLCELCNIIPNNPQSTMNMFSNTQQLYDEFLEENLFKDKFFLYKLESLLESDVTKQKKEKFFKEEIKKVFELKSLEIQYENKIKGLNFAIDSHIFKIQNYDFLK